MWRLLPFVLLLVMLGACRTSEVVFEDGPRLISEVTLPPVTLAPTRALTPIASPSTTERPTDPPAEITEVASNFELITPTLPPSKTASITPSVTDTPAVTPTVRPTHAPPPTDEPVLVPTFVFVTPPEPQQIAQAPDMQQPVPTSGLSAQVPGIPDQPAAPCSIPWFFNYPRVPDCPLQPPLVTEAAFEGFQYGFMVWVGAQDAIYVIYDSVDMPRWQVFQDQYEDGMPDSDPALDAQAPPYADWQPRRGFGLIWRNTPGMIDRIGWAESPYEASYTISIQLRQDGTIFLNEPFGRVFALFTNGNWELWG